MAAATEDFAAHGFEPWPADRPPPFELCTVGSWNDYCPTAMLWDGGVFIQPMVIGSDGWESFQLLKDGDWNAAFYPSIEDATPSVEHKVCGPEAANDHNW